MTGFSLQNNGTGLLVRRANQRIGNSHKNLKAKLSKNTSSIMSSLPALPNIQGNGLCVVTGYMVNSGLLDKALSQSYLP